MLVVVIGCFQIVPRYTCCAMHVRSGGDQRLAEVPARFYFRFDLTTELKELAPGTDFDFWKAALDHFIVVLAAAKGLQLGR